MTFCADTGSCALVGGDGVYLSGSGTSGDPWVINVTDPVDITALQGEIDDIEATLATLVSTYVNATGDDMTGRLAIACPGEQLGLRETSSDFPNIGFYNIAGTVRQGYIQHVTSGFVINDQIGGTIHFLIADTERARIMGDYLLFGKSAANSTVAGCELHRWGASTITTNQTNAVNGLFNKIGVANAVGQVYTQYQAAGSVIGSISVATASTVAFNTSSDGDLKENVEPVDDDLALLWMRTVEPVFFNYIETPDVTHVGYIAQDMAEVWPNGVANGVISPGHGDIADRTWDDDGNETTPTEVWQSWMMDHGKLTPFLHSALQALDRLTQTQQVTIDAQQARIETLEARLDAVEAALKPK